MPDAASLTPDRRHRAVDDPRDGLGTPEERRGFDLLVKPPTRPASWRTGDRGASVREVANVFAYSAVERAMDVDRDEALVTPACGSIPGCGK